MLWCYILGKDRLWRLKLVKDGNEGLFRKGSFEYEIHPECIYVKKFLGVKLVRCCNYLEGVRLPLFYDKVDVSLATHEIPLDEISMVISRALKNIIIILACLFSALAFITSLIVAFKVFGMIE